MNDVRDSMCAVAPSPELRERLRQAVREARTASGLPEDGPGSLLREPRRVMSEPHRRPG